MTLPSRGARGYQPKAVAEYEVTQMDDKDRIAQLERDLALEKMRVKELKEQCAGLAERALNLVWEKEALEAEVDRLHRAREGEE